MKAPASLVLAILLVGRSTGFAEVEFSGYVKLGEKSKFVLVDPGKKKTSEWRLLGQSFEGCTLVAFEQKTEILSVKKSDRIVRLALKSAHVRDGKEQLAEFRAFFRKAGAITAKDVEDRFGPPPHYSQLLLNDEDKDVTREHSWWFYPLGADEVLGVQVDQGTVQEVYYHYPQKAGGLSSERIRAR